MLRTDARAQEVNDLRGGHVTSEQQVLLVDRVACFVLHAPILEGCDRLSPSILEAHVKLYDMCRTFAIGSFLGPVWPPSSAGLSRLREGADRKSLRAKS